MNDLADNSKYAKGKKELAEKFKKQQGITDDPLNLKPVFVDLFKEGM